ncbi:Tellurite resistance protein (telA) [Roseibacterium elongatum DSM 19469]|uniref:Tellurite resistance protein (TelA) n=1 Tax=Roseicyclus elongatus DSM 19469 TaxID=1294273 RepID=W8S9D5_9RHOB|nr:Tellurite resistance protein (telA) [Roseibacterium elongatum DSM 19469]
MRIQPHFGAFVDDAQRAEDRSVLSTYASRLARVTDHSIRTVTSGGNFHVLFLNRDEQRRAGDLVRDLVPGISPETVNEIQTLSRFTFCSVYAFSVAGGGSTYVAAIAIIRDEHPDLLRRSCIHEEVAQGLGLPNDSPAARPSIFNDDEEFALLTRHDELLLRMLYDDRLTPGMQPDEARPIVRRIAAELLGGPS